MASQLRLLQHFYRDLQAQAGALIQCIPELPSEARPRDSQDAKRLRLTASSFCTSGSSGRQVRGAHAVPAP